MIQIAVCDDDAADLAKTCELIQDFQQSHPEVNFQLHSFRSGYELLDCIESSRTFDVYILDVLMSHIDGIRVGRAIRSLDQESVIIYLTASPDYALDAYRLRAFHYLLKPVDREILFPLLDQLAELVEQEKSCLLPIKTKGGIATVRMDRILYLEIRNHTFYYNLSDGSSVVSTVLRESFDLVAKPLLENRNFIKIGASFVANLFYVRSISGRNLIFSNGVILPISRSLYQEVKSAYIDYLLCSGRDN